MTEQADSNDQTYAPVAAPGPSPGELLRRAREARELTVQALSAETVLPRLTVEALENDDFDRLGQPVFVRGYYRKCARVLEVDEDEILAAYAEHTGVPGLRAATPGRVDFIAQDVGGGNGRPFMVVLLGMAVVAVVVVAWFSLPMFLEQDDPARKSVPVEAEPALAQGTSTRPVARVPALVEAAPQKDAAVPAPVPTPEADVAAIETPASPAMPDLPEAAPTTAAGSATPETPPGGVPDETPAAEASPVATADDTRLVFRFEQRSWVKVTDATGAVLLVGNISAGNLQVADGRPPYHVVLGFAPGVIMSMADKIVYNGDNYVGASKVDRFDVNADGSIKR